jgi:hypothetical protein
MFKCATLDLRLRMVTLYAILGVFPKQTRKSSKRCYSRCVTFYLKKSLKSVIWLQNYKQNSAVSAGDTASIVLLAKVRRLSDHH